MFETWSNFLARFGPAVEGAPGRYQQGRDLAVLLTLATWRKPQRIGELYTAFGHTSSALALACPQSQVFTFDVCKELGGYNLHSHAAGEVLPRLEVGSAIRLLSEEERKRVHLVTNHGAELPKEIRNAAPYDLVFIDGDHSWRRVAEDTKLALETVSEGGVIVWDDYWDHCRELVRFIDTVNGRNGDFITLVEGTRVCYAVVSKRLCKKTLETIADL